MTEIQIVAIILFLLTFVAILSGKVNRTVAALVGATVMVALGHFMGFYSEHEAISSIDFDTVGLLLGMMSLVALLEKTGFIQYLAIAVTKWSRGRPWLLLVVLGTATTLASMFLDNVTVIILMGSVTIMICELLGISPIPYLIAEALLSDTGGVATMVGDPPNIIIATAADFTFVDFLTHLAPIVIVAWLAALVTLRVTFRRDLSASTNIGVLKGLDEKAALTDPVATRKVLVVLAAVIAGFSLQSQLGLSPAHVALTGAIVALAWVRADIDEVLKLVDWSVLVFFIGLFIMVGGVEASGVFDLVIMVGGVEASGVFDLVTGSVVELAAQQPLVAGLALLWFSAIMSAVVDNVPFTIAMVPIIKQLGTLGIPTSYLYWALALGAGFGGNGTLIGSTANVVTVSISERTSTPITSRTWMKSGLPVMIVTCIIASILYAIFFSWMNTP